MANIILPETCRPKVVDCQSAMGLADAVDQWDAKEVTGRRKGCISGNAIVESVKGVLQILMPPILSFGVMVGPCLMRYWRCRRAL